MRLSRVLADESGVVLPLVAILIVALFSIAALAVDHGMARRAGFEAQRAADAAALAGASGFIDGAPGETELVYERAREYAGRNTIMGTAIDGADADQTQIDLLPNPYVGGEPDPNGVRATIRRRAIPTLFARVFGTESVEVGAVAEARITGSGTGTCMKPFAVRERVAPQPPYGPDDWGLLIPIWEVQDPYSLLVNFYPNFGNITPFIQHTCPTNARVSIGDYINAAPDNTRVGQVNNGMNQNPDGLLRCDQTLRYDEGAGKFYRGTTEVEDWRSSCRVGTIVVYDPATYTPPGAGTVRVVNFLTVFFEYTTGQGANPNNPLTVWGRLFPYMGIPDGCEANGTCAPNMFVIRLTG